MNEKVKSFFIGIGAAILGFFVFFITGRNNSSSNAIEKRADRNHNDLRENLESDRDRERKENADIKRERNRLKLERESVGRTGSLIHNARKSISGIIKNSKGTGKE